MNRKLLAVLMAVVCSAAGCASPAQREGGGASVELVVKAKPKKGLEEPFARPPVYDAGPQVVRPGGDFEHVDYRNLDNIIVWLEPAGGTGGERGERNVASETVVLGRNPPPYVHAVAVGRRVTLVNGMRGPVSLYSVSEGNELEVPAIEPGGSATIELKMEGQVELLSGSDQPPVALLYAAPGRWVARARSGERVVFRDVPAGSYIVRSWHPRLPGGAARVTVGEGRSRGTIQVGVDELQRAGTAATGG